MWKTRSSSTQHLAIIKFVWHRNRPQKRTDIHTSEERLKQGKHKYINGLEMFVCSSCFVNNHKSVTNKSMEGSRNENSIGTSGSGEKETEIFDVDFCS